MFELEVRRTFSAAHAIIIKGKREPLHGHDWQVELVVSATSLDPEGLACDFHQLEAGLDTVLRPFASANLNETEPFDRLNPTAELVAQHIAQCMAKRLPKRVSVRSVRVTEAPGCSARFVPGPRRSTKNGTR
ncbi:MAG: 6-carboxytetrahydropterin synthase [Phycisphaerales bacterium]|nr:6-carboxytetrahydropterin synthase [Phycisphaerales bacterium]